MNENLFFSQIDALLESDSDDDYLVVDDQNESCEVTTNFQDDDNEDITDTTNRAPIQDSTESPQMISGPVVAPTRCQDADQMISNIGDSGNTFCHI